MRLGFMQPYFFPHAAHFALIANTDRWVVFDTAQYTPKRWMNRNRVLRDDSGWTWLTMAVQGAHRTTSAADVLLSDPERSRRQILGRLHHYRRHAPFAGPIIDLVDGVLSDPGDGTLVDLDVRSLGAVCDYLGVPFRPHRLSELSLDLPPVDHPGGWAPTVCAALGVEEYLNPVGGKALFDDGEFQRAGVRLLFCDTADLRYRTAPYVFEPSLSIVDTLMWCSAQEVLEHLHAARLLRAEPRLATSR